MTLQGWGNSLLPTGRKKKIERLHIPPGGDGDQGAAGGTGRAICLIGLGDINAESKTAWEELRFMV